jgi:LuxR family maltose regulon positive regulatory protein
MPILHWLESLPPAELNARPSLWLLYAWTLWVAHKSSQVEEILGAAEAALQGVAEDESTRSLVGQIAALRGMLAANHYEVETMISQGRSALEYLSPANLSVRTAVIRNLALAYQFQGDRAAAGQAYEEAIALCEATGNTFINILSTTGLGIIQESENQLYAAIESYQRVLELVGDPPGPVACAAIAGLARIAYEWNDLDSAEEQGMLGVDLARQIESIDSFASGELFLVRMKLARGDIAGAADLLNQVDTAVRRHNFVTQIPNAAAVRVLLLLQQGDLARAAQLAQAHDLPLSQARVHLAQGDPGSAAAVLEPLRQEMEARGWQDELLKTLVLQAITLHTQDQDEEALKRLGEALILAEPGGHVRVFIDEGPPMAQLLSKASARGIIPHYTARLLKEFPTSDIRHPTSQIDPLTPRELEVLQLIAQGLTNRQISERLFLALSTVKGYNRVIFDKLHVNNRTEAAARARELGLL